MAMKLQVLIPSVNGFNHFNTNPSTFGFLFLPDYCLAISTKKMADNLLC
jgi:hypothetical protein